MHAPNTRTGKGGAAVSKPKTYMPLFIGDYLADTSDLSAEEHGAYLLLLMTMWRRGGSLPSAGDRLARIASVASERWPALWTVLGPFFVEKDGRITQQRLTRELEAARNRKAAATRIAQHAARQRWARQRRADDRGDVPDRAPGDAPTSSPGDAGRNASRVLEALPEALPDAVPEAVPEAMPEAMPEQCPSTSTSTSTSTISSRNDSIRIDDDSAAGEVIAGEVMAYWNDLTERCWNAGSRDGEYLRERLFEGHSPDVSCLVVEAAVASGIQHPRQAFSRESFGGLLATRRDQRKWAELHYRLDCALERYGERRA
jgi:uncharacterized protein YdaU (DUF1376 family)